MLHIRTYTTEQKQTKNGKDRSEDIKDMVRKRRKHIMLNCKREILTVYMQIKRSPCK